MPTIFEPYSDIPIFMVHLLEEKHGLLGWSGLTVIRTKLIGKEKIKAKAMLIRFIPEIRVLKLRHVYADRLSIYRFCASPQLLDVP
jgi:hypothetical protein